MPVALAQKVRVLRGERLEALAVLVLAADVRALDRDLGDVAVLDGGQELAEDDLGLAGLLKLPEVVEVLAYARATLDPLASVALGRILLGPRYRVGFKDLALVASLAKDKSYALREEDEVEGEAAPFLFAEALEHLDEVEGLSDEGRERLEECRQELAALRVEARRPVGEFLGEIIRRTGNVS